MYKSRETKMDRMSKLMILVLTLCLVFQSGVAFHGSLGSPSIYAPGDLMQLQVNSLTSFESLLPLSYYSLPFCIPREGVRNYARNIGELLMGDKFQNSPYRIRMYKNESETFLCETNPLSVPDLNLLKTRIDESYQVNMVLDDLPVMRYSRKEDLLIRWTGFPVGVKVLDSFYVFNHLRFRILVDREKDAVVGFEVVPCSCMDNAWLVEHLRMYDKYPRSIQCHPNSVAMKIEENKPIIYTYEVMFEESSIKWHHRWDAYLRTNESSVHRLSIMNSLLVIAFLLGLNFIFFRGITRRDLLAGDIFRIPACPMLLCVITGSGIQIFVVSVVAVLFAVLGFTSPASRGDLLSSVVYLYLAFSIAAGYIAVSLWRVIGYEHRNDWLKVSATVACIFPGITFLILAVIDVLLSCNHSTGAISTDSIGALLQLWLGICVPFTLIGGYLASNAPRMECSSPVNHSLEEISTRKVLSSWLYALLAGTLPFSTLRVELFYIMSSFWIGRFYYFFGHLLIVATLLVMTCAQVSIVTACKRVAQGDLQWWWKSFLASGSAGIYVFIFCINYLIYDLHFPSGPVSIAIYLGYSFLLAITVMLATGAVGFLASFSFLRYFSPVADLDTTPDSKDLSPEDGLCSLSAGVLIL